MSAIRFKGVKDNLIITSDWEQPFDEWLSQLDAQLRETDRFFGGGKVVLEIGQKDLSLAELQNLHQLLARYEMELYSVRRGPPDDGEATINEPVVLPPVLEESSVPTQKIKDKVKRFRSHRAEDKTVAKGVLVKRTLRSGQVLNHSDSIILIGDVNPGAQVVAGQDIIIWGCLRGVAYAGASGDAGAAIYALHMVPSQLRIADYISRTPKEGPSDPDSEEIIPEVARIDEDKIVVEQWDLRKNRIKGE